MMHCSFTGSLPPFVRRRWRTRRPARSALAAAALTGAWLAACGGPPPPEPVQAEPEPVAVPALGPQAEPTGRVEILWDRWGVPHIFAKDETALLWAFDWAQAHSHGDLLLRLYGQARGRAAEYWGEAYLESDRWMHRNGVPARAEAWLAQQSPWVRAYLEAFTLGINAYAQTYPERIGDDVEVVLPVNPADVLAHVQRVIHFGFIANPAFVSGAARAWQRGEPPPPPEEPNGSNAWAIAPSRTTSGHAMLLANPHLPWGDYFTWYESHLVGPDLDAYGAALLGFPLPGIAFNRYLGWTHTVNTHDGVDLYTLTVQGDRYVWDGGTRPIENQTLLLGVRQSDGTLRDDTLTIRRSIHGPIVAEQPGRALALRVVGLDRPGLLEQTWRMLRAKNLGEFEGALGMAQLPMFSVVYADRDGHILHAHNGLFPVRGDTDWRDWAGLVRGDVSATLWTAYHGYFELPRAIDPPTGWLQNANDPPWTTTFPPVLDPDGFPAHFAPRSPLAFRPQRSARMLMEDDAISLDEMIAYKHSTYAEAADHVIEDLVLATRIHGTERARRAALVLQRWDRQAEADSRGTILFEAFLREFYRQRWTGGSPFELAWRVTSPLTTPDGLADPETAAAVLDRAAAAVQERYGSLDRAWGTVHRIIRDGVDLPANGGAGALGIFRVVGFDDLPDGRQVATAGDSWVAAIEFGPTPRAFALLTYGNASQPGSPHRTDQLRLFARKQLRPVLLTRAQIEASLRFRERY